MSANETETVLYQLWHCCGPLYTQAVGTLKGRCGRRAENLHRINYMHLFVYLTVHSFLAVPELAVRSFTSVVPGQEEHSYKTIHIHSIRTSATPTATTTTTARF